MQTVDRRTSVTANELCEVIYAFAHGSSAPPGAEGPGDSDGVDSLPTDPEEQERRREEKFASTPLLQAARRRPPPRNENISFRRWQRRRERQRALAALPDAPGPASAPAQVRARPRDQVSSDAASTDRVSETDDEASKVPLAYVPRPLESEESHEPWSSGSEKSRESWSPAFSGEGFAGRPEVGGSETEAADGSGGSVAVRPEEDGTETEVVSEPDEHREVYNHAKRYLADFALGADLFWWPAPAATVCWHTLFAALPRLEGRFFGMTQELSEQVAHEVVGANKAAFMARLPRETAEHLRRRTLHLRSGRGMAVTRAAYLMTSSVPSKGVERFTLRPLQGATRLPGEGETRYVPLYAPADREVCLATHCSGPSAQAGIVRAEAVAAPVALAGLVRAILPVRSPHRVELRVGELRAWADGATRASRSFPEPLRRQAVENALQPSRIRLAVWLRQQFCKMVRSASGPGEEKRRFSLEERATLSYLSGSPMRLVVEETRDDARIVREAEAVALFERVWASLAVDGDYVAASMDTLFAHYEEDALPQAVRFLLAWPAALANLVRAQAITHAHGGERADFVVLTHMLCSTPVKAIAPAPPAAEEVLVASDLELGLLKDIVERVVVKGQEGLAVVPVDPKSWSAPLRIIVEVRDHGHLSRTDPNYPRPVAALVIRAHDANTLRKVERRLRFLVGTASRVGDEPLLPALSGHRAPQFYWFAAEVPSRVSPATRAHRACEAVWRESAGALDGVSAVALATVVSGASAHPAARSEALPGAIPITDWQEAADELLILVTVRPGAALLLITAFAPLPLGAGFEWLGAPLRRLGIVDDAHFPAIWKSLGDPVRFSALGAIVRSLEAIGVFPEPGTDSITAQALWLHTGRALHEKQWTLSAGRLSAQLVRAFPRGGRHAQAPWGGQEGAYVARDDGTATVRVRPTEEDYFRLCTIKQDGSVGARTFCRADPWGVWMGGGKDAGL